MSETQFIILMISIFTLFEVFIIYKYLAAKKYGKIIENAAIYIVIVFFLCLEGKLRLQIQDFVIVFFIITVLGHTFVGKYFDIYHKSKTYDRYLHLFGSFTFSLLAYSILASVFKPISSPAVYVAIYVAALGISIAVIFELLEFAIDKVAKKEKYQKNQHGLADTNFDMLFNGIGAVIAALVSVYLF